MFIEWIISIHVNEYAQPWYLNNETVTKLSPCIHKVKSMG